MMSTRHSRRRKIHGPSRPLPQARARGALNIPVNIPQGSELLPVMQWLLASTCSFLREAGYSQEELSHELLQLQRDPCPTPRLARWIARRELKISAVQRLLVEWCEGLPYIYAETGDPRSLRLEGGTASLGSLLARHFPKLSAEQALACLEEHGAIVRQADGSYFPVRRYPPHVLLERVAQRSCRYLQTGLRNLRARELAESYPDLASVTARVPVRYLEEFLEQSKQQLSFAVETIQLWLMDHHVAEAKEPCVWVSIHGYVSVEYETPAGRQRPRATAQRPAPRGLQP